MNQLMKLFDVFRKPTPEALAEAELIEARRRLLEAQAAAEYSAAMVQYHQNRIHRLSNMLQS